MTSNLSSGILFNISLKPGGENGEYLVNYHSESQREMNLLVTASGEIVLSKPVIARNGLNHFLLNLGKVGKREVEISLMDLTSVVSQKISLQ